MEHSNFIKLKCPRCRSNQITYSRATIWIKCKNCRKLLTRPKGGKAKIKAKIKYVIN